MFLSLAFKGVNCEGYESRVLRKDSLGLIEVHSDKLRGTQTVGKRRPSFDLITDQLRYGPIWCAGPDAVRNAVAYAKYHSWSRSRRATIRVFDKSGKAIETHEQQWSETDSNRNFFNYFPHTSGADRPDIASRYHYIVIPFLVHS
jgi:hypothetical protein